MMLDPQRARKNSGPTRSRLATSNAWLKQRVLLALAFAVVLVGCQFTFISPYDQQTDIGVTALQKEVDGLLDQLTQTPVPSYASLQATYVDIHSQLNSLYSRNQLREKNSQTVAQLAALAKEIDDLEGLHGKGQIIPAMVAKPTPNNVDGGPARASLDQTFRAILKLEITKKETAGAN